MKQAQYILRFDDICPTMKWSIWNEIVSFLDEYDIKPIIAVIPDNHDPALFCEAENEEYWSWLRERQNRGWTIALHGYSHCYENKNGGIIKVNDYSEFAGVAVSTQRERIHKGLEILKEHGILCRTWIAPAHSFDKNTLQCLLEMGISVVSDGYSDNPFYRNGLLWIPCQLYKYVEKESGIWTVCKHPSMWKEEDLDAFKKEVLIWKDKTISFDKVVKVVQRSTTSSVYNRMISSYRCWRQYLVRKMKTMIKNVNMIAVKKGLIKIYKIVTNKGGYIKKANRAGVRIGKECRLNDYPRWGSEPWLITLGDHVEISMNVTFLTHDGATWCFRDQEQYKDVIRYGKITIHDNCFIGANATIMPGVTIGPNSIVGSGAIVTKDIEPNSVYAGVPARYICSLEEYAEKCLRETPDYDIEAYRQNKQQEVIRVLSK